MKKILFLFICVVLILTGCTYDPYSDKRPFDYGEAIWICDEYNVWFYVDPQKEDYYYPEGELQLDGNNYFCKFYFIHQTNQLSISLYPLEYADVSDTERDRSSILAELHGDCSFAEESFTLFIDITRDTVFDGKVERMTFLRQNIG